MEDEGHGHSLRGRSPTRTAQVFASTLIGMDVGSATALAEERGYEVELITQPVSFDLRLDRIRLFADAESLVTDAHVG